MLDHTDVYTKDEIDSYIYTLNIRAIITAIFGVFCIFAILRYTTRSMDKGYRFHLLNMSIWILACDLTILVLCRPHPLLPLNGGCFSGELNVLKEVISAERVYQIEFILFVFMCLATMATVCNATIHRYLFVDDIVSIAHYKRPKIYVNSLMFFIQIVWPLAGAILASYIDMNPESVVAKNKKHYPQIVERMHNEPCAHFISGLIECLTFYGPLGCVVVSQITFCCFTNFVLLALAWYKILFAKMGTISKRTFLMQRHLLISLSIQSILPYIVFGVGVSIFLTGVFLDFELVENVAKNTYLYVALHSVVNCVTVFVTIPTYSKGFIKDLRFLIYCGRYQPPGDKVIVTNISFVNSNTKILPVKMIFFRRARTL